jgi:hypothetical protein
MKKSTEMSEREIQEAMLERSFTNSKHLRRISNNLIFFFWLTMISLFALPLFYFILLALGAAIAF